MGDTERGRDERANDEEKRDAEREMNEQAERAEKNEEVEERRAEVERAATRRERVAPTTTFLSEKVAVGGMAPEPAADRTAPETITGGFGFFFRRA